ncbi:MAG: hypothetical protein ACHRXM_04150 [Isosphaerales bacterium]
MIRPLHVNPRRGYSLTVVLIFLILLFALWSTVYRTTSSLLRIETNRVLQQTRDQGAMNTLARAIQLLQYSKPNPNRSQFTYGVTVSVPNTDGSCGTATRDYTVVYTAAPTSQNPNRWQVQVSPGTYSGFPLPQISSNILWP